MACFVGATEVVKILLEKGASIDKLDASGQNCLDIAIAQRHSEVIKVLLIHENWKSLITSEQKLEIFGKIKTLSSKLELENKKSFKITVRLRTVERNIFNKKIVVNNLYIFHTERTEQSATYLFNYVLN